MALKRSAKVLLVAVSLLLLTLLSLLQVQDVSRAQEDIELIKTLNKSSNVVRVGEVLSFTIALTNNAAFTLTNVTLVDKYNGAVMNFITATLGGYTHISDPPTVNWSNVASPPIPPGNSLEFTIFFRAEHPGTVVVNQVEAQDKTLTGTQEAVITASERIEEAVGGAAPVVKFLSPPGSTPEVGQRVTFTHIITNNGAAVMTHLPLIDTYNPTYLDFLLAIPPPNITSPPGTLVWTNLATTTGPYFGPIPPDSSVVVTTIFSATTQVLNTENRASTEGAKDEFGNDLAAGFDLVGITIIGETPVPEDDSADDDDEDDAPAPTATYTPTPFPTSTPVATPTPTVSVTSTPLYLPETGRLAVSNRWVIPLLGLTLLTLGWYLYRIKKN